MGRRKTPTRVLDARGAFRKNPQRKRGGEPVVTDPLGPPPDRLTEAERAAFLEIASYAPAGVLTRSDTLHVEMTAYLLAEMRESFDTFQSGKMSLLNKMLGQCGMNPSDRAGLCIPKPPEPNPYSFLDDV